MKYLNLIKVAGLSIIRVIIMNNKYKSIISEIDRIHNLKSKLNSQENILFKKIEQLNI